MEITALALAAGLVGWTPPHAQTTPTRPIAAADPAPAPIVASPSGALVTREDLSAALVGPRLVAVGEKHDSLAQHRVQAEVLGMLADQVWNVAVGFEMISFEDQSILDDFASGKTSEAEFAALWKKAWGYDYAMYKPVFDEARKHGLRLYGLNAPNTLVRLVAKKGLEGLTPAERARLPAKIQESSDARYRAFVYNSVTGHGPAGPSALKDLMLSLGVSALSDPDAVARMLQAMAVWNETMGEQAARHIASGRTLFLVAGNGHVLYKAGVPESARRRGAPSTLVVLPYPIDDEPMTVPEMLARLRDPAQDDIQLADYFRLIP